MTAYATRAELYALGVSSTALTAVATADQDIALEAASRAVDSYLRVRHSTPLGSPYPYEIRRATCLIASWDLMVTRGFSPQGMDEAVRVRYEDAIGWLRDVARGVAQLDYTADASPSTQEAAPLIYSDESIDWEG
jgi:phage gp36-like protein